jgi:hypothetical protein
MKIKNLAEAESRVYNAVVHATGQSSSPETREITSY